MTDIFRQQQLAVRALARSKRDYAGWTQVCALLDQLPDDVVLANINELEVEVGGWAPDLRITPLRWAARLQAEGQEPRVQLCRVLGLGGTPGTGRGASRADLWRALDAPDAARIDVLGVAYCEFDPIAAPDLARRLARIGVKRLDLSDIAIGSGITHIFRLSLDGVLASIDARSCGLGKGVLEAVVADGAAIGLRELGLQDNYLIAADLEHLARLPGLDVVRRLTLSGNKFLAPGARVLAGQAPLYGLRELDLEGTQCGDEGAALLATAPALARLETLSLMSCDVKDAGAASLGVTTSLTALRELDLKFNHITAAGVRSLLASTQLTALTRLNLTYNEIEDDIVDVLASCPQVARLVSLVLDDTYLSNEARAALQALPLPTGVLDLYLVREDS
jgi:hypothetical protein